MLRTTIDSTRSTAFRIEIKARLGRDDDSITDGCKCLTNELFVGEWFMDYSGVERRLSRIMLYVDGKSKLANVLVILQANSYTEEEFAYPAQVLRRAKEESHMQSTNIRQIKAAL